MKIVAQTNKGWMLESSKEEVNNLIGYYSHNPETAFLGIGSEIRIAEMFKQLSYLERNRKELQHLAKTLREYADNLEAVRPILIEEATDGD